MPNYSILGGNRGVHELFQRPEIADVSKKPKQELAPDQSTSQQRGIRVNLSSSDQVQSLALEYDVRNMTPKEMSELSQHLFDSGLINFEHHALLSFQPEMNYETQEILPSRPDETRDFIKQWEQQKELHIRQGNHQFAQRDQKILNVLTNLESLSHQQSSQAATAEIV